MPDPRVTAVGVKPVSVPSAPLSRQVRGTSPGSSREASPKITPGSFAAALEASGVRLSTHAQKRLAARDTLRDLGEPELQRLAEAVSRAEKKGGRHSLVLMDDLAFIVDVQQRTIVTAMDAESRKEGVFTNIDTVVLAR